MAVVEGLGHRDVVTYLGSGNVVFAPGARVRAGTVAARLEMALAADLALETTVLVRSAAELASVLAANPFTAADPATLYVTFVGGAGQAGVGGAGQAGVGGTGQAGVGGTGQAGVGGTGQAGVEGVEVGANGDRARIVGPHVYLVCPAGSGRSPLANAYRERRLGVPVTTRNWRTVTALAELAGG